MTPSKGHPGFLYFTGEKDSGKFGTNVIENLLRASFIKSLPRMTLFKHIKNLETIGYLLSYTITIGTQCKDLVTGRVGDSGRRKSRLLLVSTDLRTLCKKDDKIIFL